MLVILDPNPYVSRTLLNRVILKYDSSRCAVIVRSDLLQMIEAQLEHNASRLGALPPVLQLQITLRFYASGSFQVCTTLHFIVANSPVICYKDIVLI